MLSKDEKNSLLRRGGKLIRWYKTPGGEYVIRLRTKTTDWHKYKTFDNWSEFNRYWQRLLERDNYYPDMEESNVTV
jgi:hypothetical protein